MPLADILILNAAIILGIMLLLWLISLPLKDASIVDIFWGAGFVVVSWSSLLASQTSSPLAWLTTLLVSVWGLRLAGYLAWRNIGKGEDQRYREMREQPGRNFALFSLIVVFGLQGLIMWVVSLPLQTLPTLDENTVWPLAAIGVLLWMIGISFEAGGDWQLARFKADPANRGKVLDSGFWKYTRHPNYFGDFVVWWGYYLLVLSADLSAWWTAIGPALMTYCLLYFSGVAHLERGIKERRPQYADYIRRTSAFFPWPPQAKTEVSPTETQHAAEVN